MAIADNILLISKFLASIFKIYHINIYNFCIFSYTIIPQSASFISVWLIMITTAERTAAVVVPLKVSQIFSKTRCKILITCMILFFLIITCIAGFSLEYNQKKPYLCEIKDGNFYINYFHQVFPVIKSVFGSWLPSLIAISLNTTIVVFLYKASKERKIITQSNSNLNEIEFNLILSETNGKTCKNKTLIKNKHQKSTKKEKQITIMLLTISVSFLILTLPYSLFELMRKFLNEQTFYAIIPKNKVRVFQRATLLLIDLNHSTNFIFYVLTAERFRIQLKNILIFWKKDATINKSSFAPSDNYLNYNLNTKLGSY
jgi:hypothetical protein